MDKIRKIASYVLMILLTISILVFAVYNILNVTILNEEYVVNLLGNANYYEVAKENITSGMEAYMGSSGISSDMIESAITAEIVQKDINSVIRAIYENNEYSLSNDEVKQNISNNIDKYLDENNISLDIKQKDSINKVVDNMMKYYDNNIFPIDVIDYLKNAVTKIKNIFVKLRQLVYFLPICTLLALIVVNIKKVSSAIYIVGIAVMSSGITLEAINIYLNNAINIGNISIANDNISTFLNDILKDVIDKINTFGIVGIVIGLIIIVLSALASNKIKKVSNEMKHSKENKWQRYV